MKVHNRTHWATASLRAIITRVAREELSATANHRWRLKHLNVHVRYSRRKGNHTGCAWLKGTSATLRIPKAGVDSVEFAWLCAHEFSHTRGMHHRQMPEDLKYFTAAAKAQYAWAAGFPIVRKAAPRKPTADERLTAKHTHVLAKLKRAESRLKRAATIARKWRQKARYYEQKMAARPQTPPSGV